jgi:hypothetical protein
VYLAQFLIDKANRTFISISMHQTFNLPMEIPIAPPLVPDYMAID